MSTAEGDDRALIGAWGITLSRYLGLVLIGLAWTVLLARSLGPEGTGRVLVASTLPALLAPVVNLGLPSAVGWLTAQRRFDERPMVGAAIGLAVGLGALSWALASVVILLLGSATGSDVGYLLAGVSGLLPFIALSVVAALFLGRERFGAYAVTLIAAPALALLVGVVGVAVADPSVLSFVLFWTVSYFVVAAVTVSFLSREADRPTLAFLRSFFAESLAFGWKVWIGEAAVSARSRIDLYLVAALVGSVAAGLYGAAVGVAAQVGLVSQAAFFVVFPTVAQAGKSETDRRRQTPMMARLTFSFSILAATGVVLFGKPLIELFLGADFLDAYVPLVWYLPAAVLLSVSRILTADISARGMPGVVMVIALATLVLNVALNLALIPSFGMRGAAASASLTALVNVLWRFVVYRRITGVSLRDLVLLRRSDLKLVLGRIRRSTSAA